MSEEQRIQLSQRDLERASVVGLLRAQQIVPLWQFLAREYVPESAAVDDRPRFSFTHVLYYLGGMLAIGAMSVFMTLGWQRFGGWGVFFIALLYMGRGVAADAAVRGAEAADSDGDHGDARRRAGAARDVGRAARDGAVASDRCPGLPRLPRDHRLALDR